MKYLIWSCGLILGFASANSFAAGLGCYPILSPVPVKVVGPTNGISVGQFSAELGPGHLLRVIPLNDQVESELNLALSTKTFYCLNGNSDGTTFYVYDAVPLPDGGT